MFQGLSILNAELNQAAAVAPRTGHKAVLIVHRHAATMQRITKSLHDMQRLTQELSDLRHLKAVIAVNGINRSLMSFVNPGNKIISKHIPALPANESLDAISLNATDRRTVAAVEGISETLDAENQLIATWISTAATDVDQLLSEVEAQFSDFGQAISASLTAIEQGDLSDVDLASVTLVVLPYDAAMARLDALADVLPDMDALISDPTDGDAMDSFRERINTIVEKLGPICGLSVEESAPYLLLSGDVSEEFTPKSGTLADLGYTADNLAELLRRADNVVDELSGLIERKEAIVQQLNEASSNVAALDNDVPPAVDNAIVSGDPDQDTVDTGAGVTQADMYHNQASSHIYALAVITAVSLAAVSETLAIADEIIDDDDVAAAVVVDVTEE